MKFKIILFIYISGFLVSCNAKKTIIGKYRSNFAEMGFFITKIELNRDNTFHYEFSGDLLHTELDGKYRVENKKLYLRFNKLKGETESKIIKVSGKDTIVNFENLGNSHSYELKKENEIEYHLKYKISKQKLFVYNVQTDQIVRKANGYSEQENIYFLDQSIIREKDI